MRVDEAMRALVGGDGVRRAGWTPGRYAVVSSGEFAIVDPGGAKSHWKHMQFDVEALMADDWEVVECKTYS